MNNNIVSRFRNVMHNEGVKGVASRILRRIKTSLKKLLWRAVYFIKYNQPVIVLESVPNLSDNTKAVFDEMIRRGLNKKYCFVWLRWDDNERKLPIPNCEVYEFGKGGIANNEKDAILRKRTKCIICCNRFIEPRASGQKSFYLAHGMPIKNVRNYYNMPDSIDYCFATGDGLKKVRAYTLKISEEKVIALGFPRNDVLFKKVLPARNYFPDKENVQKVVVWYPTFRKHKGSDKKLTDCTYSLPLLHDASTAEALNVFAKEHNVLLVLKPHFAQDVSDIKDLGLSNILFINDDFFSNNKISSYEFLAGCDALLTDYSSVYYDYLLCDKPIAVIWEDIEEYRRNPGFAVDIDCYMKGAEKVYTEKQLESFLLSVVEGRDSLCDSRREIRDLVHYAADGRNAIRVTDFIVEKACL